MNEKETEHDIIRTNFYHAGKKEHDKMIEKGILVDFGGTISLKMPSDYIKKTPKK